MCFRAVKLLITRQNCVLMISSKSNDVADLKEQHFTAMRELQEAHTNSLSKMADIVTELER